MPSQADAGQPAVPVLPAHIVIVDGDPAWLEQTAASLEHQGYRVSRTGDNARALAAVRDARPDLLVVEGTAGGPDSDLREFVRARRLPVVVVLDAVPDPDSWASAYGETSDWVLRSNVRTELPARVGCALGRRRIGTGTTHRVLADAQFFSLVIHDLRTPLNVIGLSLRMIGQAVPKGDPDLDEDLRFVDENFKQIERMLAQLSDYFRLFEGDEPLYIREFSPQTLLGEVLENRAFRPGPKRPAVRLDVQATCPRAVALDQGRARLALQHGLTNALAAAGEGTVVVTLRGQPGRWIVEIATDRPAPCSVHATELHSQAFERLCGTAAERRGMDLAIAARVTELFHGSARLDVAEGGTTLVFDWPERLPDESASDC